MDISWGISRNWMGDHDALSEQTLASAVPASSPALVPEGLASRLTQMGLRGRDLPRPNDAAAVPTPRSGRPGFDRSMPARHSGNEWMFRMEAPAPGPGVAQFVLAEAIDARVIEHGGPTAGASASPEAGPAPKRRKRKSSAWAEDQKLLEDFEQAMVKGGTPAKLAADYAGLLHHFCEWLVAKGRPPLIGRMNTQGLDNEFEAYKRACPPRSGYVTTAMTALKQSVQGSWLRPVLVGSGVDRPRRGDQPEIVEEDESVLKQFEQAAKAGAKVNDDTLGRYLRGARRLSEWVSSHLTEAQCHASLTGLLDDPRVTEAARQMKASSGHIPGSTILECLRTFVKTGNVTIRSYRNTRAIPSTDKLLIEQFKQRLEAAAKENAIRSAGNKVSAGRSFAAWLQAEGRPGLASCLLDGSLMDEIDRYLAKLPKRSASSVRSMLSGLSENIKRQEVVGISCAQIDGDWFVAAVRNYACGSSIEALAERMLPHEEADLRQLLNEAAPNWLTPLGTAYLETFPECVRHELESLLAQRAADLPSDVWHRLQQQPLYSPGNCYGGYAPPWSPQELSPTPSHGLLHHSAPAEAYVPSSPQPEEGEVDHRRRLDRGEIVEEDRALFAQFAETAQADSRIAPKAVDHYLVGFRRLSRWVSARETNGQRGIGLASQLDTPGAIEAVVQGMDTAGLSVLVPTMLDCLRAFARTGKVQIGSHRKTRGIPSTDRLLIQELAERLDAPDRRPPRPQALPGEKPRKRSVVNKISEGRLFSAWLQAQGKPGLASCLLDGSWAAGMDRYVSRYKVAKTATAIRSRLKSLLKAIERDEIVGVACAQIDGDWFVRAVQNYAGSGSVKALVEQMPPDEEADLRQLLDEASPNGLTPLGAAYLETFPEPVRQELKRLLNPPVQPAMADAVPASSVEFPATPSEGWLAFAVPSHSAGAAGSLHAPGQRDTSIFGSLESLVPLSWGSRGGDDGELQDDAHYGGPSSDDGVSSDVWQTMQHQPLYSPPPAAHHGTEDIGPVVGEGWQHGPQFMSDVLIGVLGHRGLLPSQYMPQTMFYIHGQPYMATLDPGMQEPTNTNPMGLIVRLTPRLQGG